MNFNATPYLGHELKFCLQMTTHTLTKKDNGSFMTFADEILALLTQVF